MPNTDNLAATWKDFQVASGETVTSALVKLNAACGEDRNYTQASLSRWVRGIRYPDPVAREAMLRDVLPSLLRESYSEAEERLHSGDSIDNATNTIAARLAEKLK